MKYFIYGCFAILLIIIILAIIYFLLLIRLKGINKRIYRYKEENEIKDNNVLIVYQKSLHETTYKIASLVKDTILNKGYGYSLHTLSKKIDTFQDYKYVILVMPVYFGEINEMFINIVKNYKIKNLVIIYNGLNKESNNEDKIVKNNSINKYKKIKVHTEDINDVVSFIDKEVL